MARRAEFRMICKGNGHATECHRAGNEGQYDGGSSRQKRTLCPFASSRCAKTDETFLCNRRKATASVALNLLRLSDAGTTLDTFHPARFQLMLRSSASERKMLHDERGHSGHIVQIEQRNSRSTGLSDTTASSPSGEIGISPICSRTMTIFG